MLETLLYLITPCVVFAGLAGGVEFIQWIVEGRKRFKISVDKRTKYSYYTHS